MNKKLLRALSGAMATVMLAGALPFTAVADSFYANESICVEENRKEADIITEDFSYNILDDGTVEIARYTGTDSCPAMPLMVNGMKVTRIGDDSFYANFYITHIAIPDSVTSIGAWAFNTCINLTNITIPDSVTSIGTAAFKSCSFTSIKIPDSVTSIGADAFSYCDELESVIIGDGITSIGESTFDSCIGLTSIIIGDSVTSIGNHAFYLCSSLTDVYYAGSEEEWNSITIGNHNEDLLNATIHYNYKSQEEINIENFVERLYANMLGRPSDAGGKAKWVEKLNNGATAADIAVNFVLSPELKQQKLSNETFVKRMYQTMLDRTPADKEVANWASYLEAGCTYAFVFRGFLTAPEFANLCASYGIKTGTYAATENRDVNGKLTKFISRLYTKALNRAYDVSGLNFHTGNYISGKYTLDVIASGFIFSPEFEKRNLSNENFVECMYNTFFDRASDASGKAKWLQKMANGMTREEVFNGFVISPEYKALVKSFGL